MFSRCIRALLLALVGSALGSAGFVSAQSQTQDSSQQQTQKKKKTTKSATSTTTAPANKAPAAQPAPPPPKPKPLFGGSLTLKSSRQSKDATTLGFNGLTPNGDVSKAALDATPTPDDTTAAQQIAAYQINPAQLDSFIQAGGLNATAAPKEAAKGKK
jgi:hypothetical protein